MNTDKQWYIYVLRDPRFEYLNQVRYVGWTFDVNRRLRDHIKSARREYTYRAKWIKKLETLGLKPILEIIDIGYGETWQAVEQRWIAYYRDLVGDRLTNTTTGGDGVPGWVPSDETKAKIAAAHRGRRGHRHAPETIEKMKAARKLQVFSEETKHKISESKKGKKLSPEHLENMRLRQTGRVHTEETKQKISAAHKGRVPTDEARKNMGISQRGRKHTPETKAKMSASRTGIKASPESTRNRVAANPRRIRVRRVEDGMVFSSVADAARSVSISLSSIYNAMNKGIASCGYHWERVA